MEHTFRLLQCMDEEGRVSQRELARRAALSVGKVNALIARLQEDGLIRVEKEGHSSVYSLTPAGDSFLRRLLVDRRQPKLRLKPASGPVRTAVILAAGRRKDFTAPACLLPLPGGETLLSRNLSILYESGIEEVVVVGGYEAGALRAALSGREIFAENPQYRFTGTMTSLAAAAPHIRGKDFLLVEGDLVYERQLIPTLLADDAPCSIITANVSGSGDEAFVETDAMGDLMAMSMDIRQLNRIHGEMIGVSRISAQLFDMMMETFAGNENPYFNYEYLLAELAHLYRIRCLRVDDLAWGEVDDEPQYRRMITSILPIIGKREETHRLETARVLVRDIFDLPALPEITPAGGMTNTNYHLRMEGEDYILRIPGPGTAAMIDRAREAANDRWAAEAGFNARTRYFDAESGVKVTLRIPHAETLLSATARHPASMREVADLVRRLHTSGAELSGRFSFLEELERYEEINRRLGGFWPEGYADFRREVMAVRDYQLAELGEESAPCHNDLVPQNFVRGDGRLYLIDWEYAGMNDPAWDLASHLLECEHTPEEADYFLAAYDPEADLSRLKARIQVQMIYQDLLWSVWSWAKMASGIDYREYAEMRYARCRERVARLAQQRREGRPADIL